MELPPAAGEGMQMPVSPVESEVAAEAQFSPGDCWPCVNDTAGLSLGLPLVTRRPLAWKLALCGSADGTCCHSGCFLCSPLLRGGLGARSFPSGGCEVSAAPSSQDASSSGPAGLARPSQVHSCEPRPVPPLSPSEHWAALFPGGSGLWTQPWL